MQISRVALMLAVVGSGVWGLPLTPVSSNGPNIYAMPDELHR